jgi:predicted PurR-regulated permease PerM
MALFFGSIPIAILFSGLHRRLLRSMPSRTNLAAVATVLIIVVIVILPLTILTASLVSEASEVYDRIQSGDINFGNLLQRFFDSIPGWGRELLNRLGLSDLAALKGKLSAGLSGASKVAAVQVVHLGQSTFGFLLNLFVMLYLLFFLLRDGVSISQNVREALPLAPEYKNALIEKFVLGIRATVKGNMLVALLQGGLGGLIFWLLGLQAPLLWAGLMAIFSLLPAVGAAIVWFPAAIYLLATGVVWKGAVLLVYGVLIISLADNVARPLLVGKDTNIPDYLVLISTLGGVAIFGVNGFIIGPVITALFLSVWEIFTRRKGKRGITCNQANG